MFVQIMLMRGNLLWFLRGTSLVAATRVSGWDAPFTWQKLARMIRSLIDPQSILETDPRVCGPWNLLQGSCHLFFFLFCFFFWCHSVGSFFFFSLVIVSDATARWRGRHPSRPGWVNSFPFSVPIIMDDVLKCWWRDRGRWVEMLTSDWSVIVGSGWFAVDSSADRWRWMAGMAVEWRRGSRWISRWISRRISRWICQHPFGMAANGMYRAPKQQVTTLWWNMPKMAAWSEPIPFVMREIDRMMSMRRVALASEPGDTDVRNGLGCSDAL